MELLNRDELIKGKYYCCQKEKGDMKFYFKFDYYYYYNIYCVGFIIRKEVKKIPEYILVESNQFCDLYWLKNCYKLYEINFKLLLDYLPSDNLDKKYFLRKEKIEYLLKK